MRSLQDVIEAKSMLDVLRSMDKELVDKNVSIAVTVTIMVPVQFSTKNGKVTRMRDPSMEDIAAAAAKRGGIVAVALPSMQAVEREARNEKLLESETVKAPKGYKQIGADRDGFPRFFNGAQGKIGTMMISRWGERGWQVSEWTDTGWQRHQDAEDRITAPTPQDAVDRIASRTRKAPKSERDESQSS